MKTVILAGGLGLRLSEKTQRCPKPMVTIGNYPMLWHIMQLYQRYGFDDFIVAMGYKKEKIIEYFGDFDRVELVDTGEKTMTGGRLKRLKEWIGNDTFMMTYGDGLSSVNIKELVEFHKSHGRLATITAVHPPARFGCLHLDGEQVVRFDEKPQADQGWINGGFFVLEPEVLDAVGSDHTVWEKGPLESLAKKGELMAFFHSGFWHPMDTLREQILLEKMWLSGSAPWVHIPHCLQPVDAQLALSLCQAH